MPRNWGIYTSSRPLILKHASAGRPLETWGDDDYDVLAGDAVVGRIMKSNNAPEATPWFWSLGYGHHEDRTPTHGYSATREEAMAAFAKSWRRE
jgi:hypothetical protein